MTEPEVKKLGQALHDSLTRARRARGVALYLSLTGRFQKFLPGVERIAEDNAKIASDTSTTLRAMSRKPS